MPETMIDYEKNTTTGITQGGRIMDFEERWGFAPDSDYEELKCNKTPKENK